MKTLSMLSVGISHDRFIKAGITAGRFTSASEAGRAALHLLERQEAWDRAKLEWLRGAAQEGLDAIEGGNYTTLEPDDDLHRFFSEIRRESRGKREGGSMRK